MKQSQYQSRESIREAFSMTRNHPYAAQETESIHIHIHNHS